MCVEMEYGFESREHVEQRWNQYNQDTTLCLVRHYRVDEDGVEDKSVVVGFTIEYLRWTDYGGDGKSTWFADEAEARAEYARRTAGGSWVADRNECESDDGDWREDANAYLMGEIAKDLRAHGARVREF